MASTLTAFDAVRARIAAAALGTASTAQVGEFVLRERQRESVEAVRRALRTHGGALVADAVGSGKTVLALAVAADYHEVLVLAPAALREQWQRAAARAEVSLRIASHESLSRGSCPATAPLIVVDEAHHFRTRASLRYAALATLARGQHLLMLSATPVVNRQADRDALLALFLGKRAASADVMGRVILRRDATAAPGIEVRRLAPLHGAADVPGVAGQLAALPPPLPTSDGSVATALLRITLAMAWSSSLAALDAALRRRLQRGSAVADVLREGRWPSRETLRDWVLGDDAVQLAIPFDWPDLTVPPPLDAGETLAAHLGAVHRLRETIDPWIARDTAARASAIRALLRREVPRRAVLLAQHAVTVRALHAELRAEPGVVAIVGTRVHAAAGRWTRDEVLRALGPNHPGWRTDDPCGIRLLLATDILAEGVELQGCATLIHGDVPWTPARLEQRLGRVARDGQRLPVHELQFALPAGAEDLLTLRERLQRKRRARGRALATADDVARLQELLRAWRDDGDAPSSPAGAIADRNLTIAGTSADHDGFIAVLARDGGGAQLLGGIFDRGRWHVSRRAESLFALVSAVREERTLDRQSVRAARRVILAWRRRQRARQALRAAPNIPDDLLRRVARRLDAWLGAVPLSRRQPAIARAMSIRRGLEQLRGIAAERAIDVALREPSDETALSALEALIAEVPESGTVGGGRLTALLILRRSPASPARRGSEPGSAATR